MHCLGSFLLQDMLLSVHEFAFEGQNTKFTVNFEKAIRFSRDILMFLAAV